MEPRHGLIVFNIPKDRHSRRSLVLRMQAMYPKLHWFGEEGAPLARWIPREPDLWAVVIRSIGGVRLLRDIYRISLPFEDWHIPMDFQEFMRDSGGYNDD